MSEFNKNASVSYEIRVISLSDSLQRREKITNQMQACGLEFQFFDAVDARKMSEADLAALRLKHKPYHGMSIGGIACTKSHYELMRQWQASSNTDFLVVMEDDANVTENLKYFLEQFSKMPLLNFTALKIGGRYQKNKRTAILTYQDFISVTYPFMPSYCSVAYIVNRKNAHKLISHLELFDYDTDEKITKDVRLGMPVYEVSPFIVEESGLPSTLSDFSSTRRHIAFLPLRRLVNNFHIAKRISVILLNHIMFSRKKLRLVKIR